MLFSLPHGYWLTLLLAVPTAGFLVRLFMIQHDCGHGSFFRRRWANDVLGRTIGVLTLTPYAYWRRSHAIHHATSGNLDRRGTGDIDMLTVAEYRALSTLRSPAPVKGRVGAGFLPPKGCWRMAASGSQPFGLPRLRSPENHDSAVFKQENWQHRTRCGSMTTSDQPDDSPGS